MLPTTAGVTGRQHTPRQRTWHTPTSQADPVVCAHASPQASTLLLGDIAAKGGSPPRQSRSAHFALRAPAKNQEKDVDFGLG
ncbi:MAG: hypothetical protein AB4063_02630 [Crocosphaera sp.]